MDRFGDSIDAVRLHVKICVRDCIWWCERQCVILKLLRSISVGRSVLFDV